MRTAVAPRLLDAGARHRKPFHRALHFRFSPASYSATSGPQIVPAGPYTKVTGIAGVHADRSIGKSIVETMGLFHAPTIVALMTGLVSVETLQPGFGRHIDVHALDPKEVAKHAAQAKPLDTVDMLLHVIPKSFRTPFAGGEVLPVLFIVAENGIETIGNLGPPIATLHVARVFFVFVVSARLHGFSLFERRCPMPSRWRAW